MSARDHARASHVGPLLLAAVVAMAAAAGCSDTGSDDVQGVDAQGDGGASDATATPSEDAGGTPLDAGADAKLRPRPLVVDSSQDLGFLSKPPHVVGRDGGASCGVGGKVLWTFGDTLLNPKSTDGQSLRSNTAALADLTNPTQVTEPLDASGAPFAFVPFTAAEKAYNDSTGKGDDRYALWVNSLIPDGAGGCLAFFGKIKIGAGQLNYTNEGAGIARVTGAKTTSKRAAALLFSASDPNLSAVMSDGGYVYVYMALAANKGIVVGRAPLAQVATRAAYMFYDGATWQPDPTKGKPTGIAFLSSLSVSYNPYLRAYLAVGSVIFSADIVALTAPSPEGPWSASTKIFTGMAAPGGSNDYAGIEHPELAQGGGQTVRLTYYHPSGTFSGELRLAEVRFK